MLVLVPVLVLVGYTRWVDNCEGDTDIYLEQMAGGVLEHVGTVLLRPQ